MGFVAFPFFSITSVNFEFIRVLNGGSAINAKKIEKKPTEIVSLLEKLVNTTKNRKIDNIQKHILENLLI